MKIVGVMRLHDFPLALGTAIRSLAEHVDGMFFLAHNADARLVEQVAAHPKCELIKHYNAPWHNPTVQNEAFKIVAQVKPDIVVFPDEDEILPGRFGEELSKFMKTDEAIWSMACWYFQCWGDTEHIIADHCYRVNMHCVALRWREDIDFTRYAGWDWPSEYYRHKKYRSPYPLRHLAFMDPELRRRRDGRPEVTSKGDRGPWWRTEHPSIAYDPDMTWKQYLEQAKQWTP